VPISETAKAYNYIGSFPKVSMKTIQFLCVHCELVRPIEIVKVTTHYVMGNCSFCKSKIVVNHKRLKKKLEISEEVA